ncbi:MAG: aspartate/glutamate racemase family protein [Alphaproteobacteria bacterium]|nr:MAG: aspartate/glutamate racemase family protein [Alphaproteobacteria bacterium]
MKTIGIIGGMSWESTAVYYRLLNEGVRARLGGQHSAPLLIWSADFAEIEALQASGSWEAATALMVDVAKRLEGAGADLLLIATNTMHLCADAISAAVSIPLLHIADATGAVLRGKGLNKPLLLGTRYTMEMDFYKGRLTDHFGFNVRVPGEAGREEINRIIYDELCQGEISDNSRARMLEIIAAQSGVDSVILGCTEIGLLIDQRHTDLPVFDTTEVHAEAALEQALG